MVPHVVGCTFDSPGQVTAAAVVLANSTEAARTVHDSGLLGIIQLPDEFDPTRRSMVFLTSTIVDPSMEKQG